MPIRGEARQKTYRGFQPISKGIVVAHHEILGENCVQKTYAPAGRDDAIAFAEPRLLNELDHRYITPIREAQFDPDQPGCVTIVMRVYEGGSIHDAITKAGSRFSTGTAMAIIQHAAEALAYLHGEKGYVHRDVKPKNILLNGDRTTGFLADFGSAARFDPATRTAALVPTTALYQAPEGGRMGRIGPPADVYALGLTAFETLNGLFAYETLDAQALDARINRGQRALPERMLAPSAFAPHVPDTLRTLVRLAYHADSAKRPTAAGLVRRLRNQKCVDWLHVEGDGLDGEWSGWWPPGRRPERQIQLRVTSKVLAGGADRGRRRLRADYKSDNTGGWRTVGVGAETVETQDVAALSAFFSAVDAHAFRRWPA
jgi:serine/threonine protein kinase